MDSLVRLRCSQEERDKWFYAAGGKMKFSSWARDSLNVASDPESGADCNVKVEAKPAVTTPSPAKPTTSKGGLCALTGYDSSVCRCASCRG